MTRVQSARDTGRGFILTLLVILLFLSSAQAERSVRIGVVEGGEYVWHVVLRQLLHEELPRMLPDSITAEFVPSAFVTSQWNREQFDQAVKTMLQREQLDVVIAMGPWSVEALLAAGCTTPIVAMHRFDPEAEQLIDSTGRPIAENLTVTAFRNRYAKDIASLFALLRADKIGFLLFPSGDELDRVTAKLAALGERADFEVVTATGTNNIGTYAFFKAYQQLDKDVDALYLSPTWGLSAELTGEFLAMAARDGIPVLSSEGIFHVSRGAFMANSGSTAIQEAAYAVWKIRRIAEGAVPADLPVYWQEPSGLAVNEATAAACGVTIDDYTAANSILFGTNSPSGELPLTVGDAISQAIAANPGYLAGYEAIAAAAKEAEAARAGYLPELRLSGRFGYVDDNAVTNSAPTETNWQGEAALTLYQNIFDPVTIQQIKALSARERVAENDHRQARLDLEQAVTLAFLNLVAAEELVAAEISQLQVIDRFLEYEIARATIPDGPAVTGRGRWQSEKGLASQRLLLARGNREVARVLLNSLLGRPLESVIVPDMAPYQGGQFEDNAIALRPLIGTAAQRRRQAAALTAAALTDHPGVAAIDAELESVTAQHRVRRAAYLPEIGFQASLGLQDKLENRSGFEEEPMTWGADVRFNWPLFRGGARGKESAAFELERSRLEYRRDDYQLTLQRDVTNALTRLSQALFSGVLIGNAAIDAQAHLSEMARHPDTSMTLLLDAVALSGRAHREAILARVGYFRQATDVVRVLGWSMYDRNTLPTTAIRGALSEGGAGEDQ